MPLLYGPTYLNTFFYQLAAGSYLNIFLIGILFLCFVYQRVAGPYLNIVIVWATLS